jgi:mannose-6-phosphate isomerase-like protein (cupin superfamily)
MGTEKQYKQNIEVIKKFELNVPSWKEVIDNLNSSIQKGDLIKSNDRGFFVSHKAYEISKVDIIRKKLNAKGAHLYVNFLYDGNAFPKHKDEVDVVFWQIIGQTKWIVDKEYTLEPGDLIKIPKNTLHEVKPLSARAGISFGI